VPFLNRGRLRCQAHNRPSAWGELTLVRKFGNQVTRAAVRERLLHAAGDSVSGWEQVDDLPDVESPDLRRYGIIDKKEDLALTETSALPGQNPPTHYSCRIWISDKGDLIVISYRVDGE
jgi:hypothetical protein